METIDHSHFRTRQWPVPVESFTLGFRQSVSPVEVTVTDTNPIVKSIRGDPCDDMEGYLWLHDLA